MNITDSQLAMNFTISRETLLKPLQMVAGTVERRQTLPILSHILLQVTNDQLAITATDLEVELQGRVQLPQTATLVGATTLPARKFIDICRTLPEKSMITVQLHDNQAIVTAGRSRFVLATLPAADFPVFTESPAPLEFTITQQELQYLIVSTQFSIAQNDVRYYLNGLFLSFSSEGITAVATDGHRLSLAKYASSQFTQNQQIIVPRKGVVELLRLLDDDDQTVTVYVTHNYICIKSDQFTFSSKLIDGRFPDYQRVIPRNIDKELIIERDVLRDTLARVAILSNEKYRGVRLQLRQNLLRIQANNPEQEEAEEDIEVHYQDADLDIGFNVGYLLDVLHQLPTGPVKLSLSDTKSSLLMASLQDDASLYVIMPMRV